MSEPTKEEWAVLLPAYRALKAEWEAGRKPVVITSARLEALMAAAQFLLKNGPSVFIYGFGASDTRRQKAEAVFAALRAAGKETEEWK